MACGYADFDMRAAITKNGLTRLGGPQALDPSKFKTDNKEYDKYEAATAKKMAQMGKS